MNGWQLLGSELVEMNGSNVSGKRRWLGGRVERRLSTLLPQKATSHDTTTLRTFTLRQTYHESGH